MTVDGQPVGKPTCQPGVQPVGASTAEASLLPLVAGDHLSRAEFERRYEAMPQVKKAELVEGDTLAGGKYAPMQPGDDGVLRSQVFPGLWLDSQKLWSNDVSGLLAVLHEGLRSPEHAELVARLNSQ